MKSVITFSRIQIFSTVPAFIIINIFFIIGCTDDPANESNSFTDPEGNEYPMGKMCDGKYWMLKNLAVTKFRNGDPIPYGTQQDWMAIPEDTAAYCMYGDDPSIGIVYGNLYNWYAVTDTRRLAPTGWHVATRVEWSALVNCSGGEEVAGVLLKEAGSAHWVSGNGNNESGFAALPGSRRLDIPDGDLGIVAVWWTPNTSVDCAEDRAVYFGMHVTADKVYSACGLNSNGASVRCVRDE